MRDRSNGIIEVAGEVASVAIPKGAAMPARQNVTALGTLLLLIFVATSQGCALLGWSCRSGQKAGPVTTVTSRVEAGRITSHLVPYDQEGTQNDVRITWSGHAGADAPRIRVYATSARCMAFTPPSEDLIRGRAPSAGRRTEPSDAAPQTRIGSETDDPCSVMSGRQFTRTATGELVQDGLVVTGGPKQSKPDFHEYKVHVVGDPRVAATYSISITWFRGPDC